MADLLSRLNEPWAILIVGSIAGVGSLVVYSLRSAADMRSDERKLLAEAYATVVLWREIPYRIARRLDDAPETIRPLIDEFHELQCDLIQHQAWITITDESLGRSYRALVDETKRLTAPCISKAWEDGPQGRESLGNRFDIVLGGIDSSFRENVKRRVNRRWGMVLSAFGL